MNPNLEKYYQALTKAQEEKRAESIKKNGISSIGRVETPAGCCKTLWIPHETYNRTATIDLNHSLIGFDEKGRLLGENANCSTLYTIVEIPHYFNDDDIEILAIMVAKEIGSDDHSIRVLKDDGRVPVILRTIQKMQENTYWWITLCYDDVTQYYDDDINHSSTDNVDYAVWYESEEIAEEIRLFMEKKWRDKEKWRDKVETNVERVPYYMTLEDDDLI